MNCHEFLGWNEDFGGYFQDQCPKNSEKTIMKFPSCYAQYLGFQEEETEFLGQFLDVLLTIILHPVLMQATGDKVSMLVSTIVADTTLW